MTLCGFTPIVSIGELDESRLFDSLDEIEQILEYPALLIGAARLAEGVAQRETHVGAPRYFHCQRDLWSHAHADRAHPGGFELGLDQADRPVAHRSAGNEH